MLILPKTTVVGKRIPKETLYKKAEFSIKQKRSIIDDILSIEWKNKLSCDTINVSPGKTVSEIQIFAVTLKSGNITDSHLSPIDASIPYPVLYLVQYDGKVQAWMAYKEPTRDGFMKTVCYFHTIWQTEDELSLTLQGITLDDIYTSLLWQIADTSEWKKELTLRENIDRAAERDKLKKQIAALENKMRREKQFNLQVEMNTELKKMRKELDSI